MIRPRRAGPPRKRTLRPITAFLAGAVGVLVLGAAGLLIGPYDPNALDPAETHNVATVEIADLAVPVVDSEPTLDDPRVWLRLPGPSPQFDTSEFGPDLSFTPGEPGDDDLEDGVIDAVYVGDLDGQPFYIYSQTAPSIFDWFSELIFGNLSGQTLGTSLDCCTGGDMDREGGFPGVSGSQRNDSGDILARPVSVVLRSRLPEGSVELTGFPWPLVAHMYGHSSNTDEVNHSGCCERGNRTSEHFPTREVFSRADSCRAPAGKGVTVSPQTATVRSRRNALNQPPHQGRPTTRQTSSVEHAPVHTHADPSHSHQQ